MGPDPLPHGRPFRYGERKLRQSRGAMCNHLKDVEMMPHL